MTDVIRDLPRDERPRERLFTHGPETLSNAELLAILLGSGVRGKNAIQLAREILIEGIAPLQRRDPNQLSAIAGVGPAKAARLIAAIELARRMGAEERGELPLYDPVTLGAMLLSRFAGCEQERLGVALLNSRYRIVREREVFVGTINSALVSTRDLLRFALADNAVAVVIYHNHPSGDPTPSREDETFTIRVRDSLKLADIELVDHLVIGANRFCSMRQRGLF